MMKKSSWLIGLGLATTILGCQPQSADPSGPDEGQPKDDPNGGSVPGDVAAALAAIPDVHVLMYTDDGLPTYMVGDMAKVGAMQVDDAVAAEAELHTTLPLLIAPMRLTTSDLGMRKMTIDADGGRHFRYAQYHNGIEVIGGDLVVHVDIKGSVNAVNGPARGDVDDHLGAHPITQTAAVNAILADARYSSLQSRSSTAPREVYIETEDGSMHKAYEVTVIGMRGQDPARDKVYVDEDTSNIIAVYPQIETIESRKVYSSGNGSSTPGTLKRSEGQAATSDEDVNGAYDGTGDAYEAYKNFFNRDSYDNAGAQLISSVHYSTNYCNAYWDGSSQMVYGDGDASQNCLPLPRAVDVTAHELTHAVTQNESGLNYSGESGGMNESMSDIFGSWVEAWVDGGKTGTLAVSTNTWLIGEKVLPPALRYMCDPAADGSSKDLWTSSVGSVDVHYSSGVGNLAFCLLSQGGTHPRNKTTVPVPGIGMAKAIRILYKAQTDILTSTSTYATERTAMQQAALSLGYDQATQDAVGCAWAAVGVGSAPGTCSSGGGSGSGSGSGSPPPPPPPGTTALTNGTAVTGQSGATGANAYYSLVVPAGQSTLTFTMSGGTGDADLYVQLGSKPTTSSYQCRPYLTGNSETCSFTPPTAGTYYVMINGYAAYSGLSITGTYAASGGGGGGGDPYLTNGTGVSGISGAASSAQYWRVAVPAGKTVTIKTSGGTGDVDLYTKSGARPTTSSYSCRPYINGNTESCSASITTATDVYVMLRGYTAYTGVTLIAAY